MQYAYRIKESDPALPIFWVFAGTKERFEHDYRKIAEGLRLQGYQDPEVNVLTLVKSSLEKPEFGNWLTVIDNADDLSIFRGSIESALETDCQTVYHSDSPLKYIPVCETGSVLYTTRNKADALKLTSEGHVIHVQEMEVSHLMDLLRNKLHNDKVDEKEGGDLIEALDRLPLAIVQAVCYIRQNSWSIPKYLQHLRGTENDVRFQVLLHDFYDKTREEGPNSVFKTWIITALQLEEQHPQAADALWKMSAYNSQKIPRYLLSISKTVNPSNFKDNESCTTGINQQNTAKASSEIKLEYLLDRAIGTLIAYSFINVSSERPGESYNLHRLVQVFAQYWLKEFRHSANEYAAKALTSLSSHFPMLEYEDWARSAELLPHLQAIIDYQKISYLPAKELGLILTAASTYLRLHARYSTARKYINLGIATFRDVLGDEDSLTIDAGCCLARCFHDENQFEEAGTCLG